MTTTNNLLEVLFLAWAVVLLWLWVPFLASEHGLVALALALAVPHERLAAPGHELHLVALHVHVHELQVQELERIPQVGMHLQEHQQRHL